MRAEELWLVGASPWFAAIWLHNDWPVWVAVGVVSICVSLSVSIALKRRKRRS
jgi:hypothetical protein